MLVMKLKLLVIPLVVLALLGSYREANSYTLTGFKFDHKTLTYSCGSPELEQAVHEWAAVSGLEDGGCSSSPDILLEVMPDALIPWPIQGYGSPGRIWIADRAQHDYGVMLHEVGHSVGLGHSSESLDAPYLARQATMFYLCCAPLNEDDIAGIQFLYGPPESDRPTQLPVTPYKYFTPMVAHNE